MSRVIIFTTEDPQSRNVTLYADTFQHIKTRHPEVISFHGIKATIQHPDFITENTSRSSIYYTKISSLDLYFNVIARIDDDNMDECDVRTTHWTQIPLKGSVIWQKRIV